MKEEENNSKRTEWNAKRFLSKNNYLIHTDAVKNYLHVIRIGSPVKAMEYINTRISTLVEIKNTSFNTTQEIERSNEKFYSMEEYNKFQKEICENTVGKDMPIFRNS